MCTSVSLWQQQQTTTTTTNNNKNNNNNDNGKQSDIDNIITLMERSEAHASEWTNISSTSRPGWNRETRRRNCVAGTTEEGDKDGGITTVKLIDLTQIRFVFNLYDSALAFLQLQLWLQLLLRLRRSSSTLTLDSWTLSCCKVGREYLTLLIIGQN